VHCNENKIKGDDIMRIKNQDLKNLTAEQVLKRHFRKIKAEIKQETFQKYIREANRQLKEGNKNV
jgi:hypothetical protein